MPAARRRRLGGRPRAARPAPTIGWTGAPLGGRRRSLPPRAARASPASPAQVPAPPSRTQAARRWAPVPPLRRLLHGVRQGFARVWPAARNSRAARAPPRQTALGRAAGEVAGSELVGCSYQAPRVDPNRLGDLLAGAIDNRHQLFVHLRDEGLPARHDVHELRHVHHLPVWLQASSATWELHARTDETREEPTKCVFTARFVRFSHLMLRVAVPTRWATCSPARSLSAGGSSSTFARDPCPPDTTASRRRRCHGTSSQGTSTQPASMRKRRTAATFSRVPPIGDVETTAALVCS